MASEQKDTTRSSFSIVNFLDQNIRYLKYPFFGVGIVGVLIIARSVRLGTKFFNVKNIPEEFFKKHFTLQGQVKEFPKLTGDEQNLTLLIDHCPIFTIPNFLRPYLLLKDNDESIAANKKKFIRVTVPGLEIKTQFYYDIQSKILGEKVAFTLFSKSSDFDTAYALIYFRVFRFKIFPSYENIGFWCVTNGYAAATAIPFASEFTKSKKFNAYYSKLLGLEKKAVKKRLGMWKEHSSERNESWFNRIKILKWFWKK